MSIGLLVKDAKEILDISTDDLKQIGLVNYSKTQYFTASCKFRKSNDYNSWILLF